jgi:nucleotide-binding universal stress UspA family protein
MLTYVASNEVMFRPHFEFCLLHVARPNSQARLDAGNHLLDRAQAFLRNKGFEAQKLMRQGVPASQILDAAEVLQFNLVVMGCRGQSALQSLVLGSVTHEVLARAHVPVLVVR